MLKQFYYILAAILVGGAASCSHERQVVPFEFDADEILKPLEPHDEDSPQSLTFGEAHIPGFIYDYEIPSDNQEVYVYLQNLTVLDINPLITDKLFGFISQQMADYGFVNDSFSLPDDMFSQLMAGGDNYQDASAAMIDKLKSGFEAQVQTIESFESPFNIYFQVYPVFLDERFVTYRQSSYAYTGGAHGMTVSYLLTYDLHTGKELAFSDIVKSADEKIVREEVAARMAYSYPIYDNITTVPQYIDSLNAFLDNFNSEDGQPDITAADFPVSDVAIVKEGLVFVYQMYELTPGSDGCPMIFLPFKDIKGCLLDGIGD